MSQKPSHGELVGDFAMAISTYTLALSGQVQADTNELKRKVDTLERQIIERMVAR